MAAAKAPKVSLLSLPVELLRMIAPNSSAHPRWLAIKRFAPGSKWDFCALASAEAINLLRALSQTCTLLRQITLPLLWAKVVVETVSELGRLYETFKLAPSLTRHVRHFEFSWGSDGEIQRLHDYRQEAGTLLDLAFADRWQLWSELARVHQCKIVEEERRAGEIVRYFEHQGRQFPEPGHAKLLQGCSVKIGEKFDASKYDWKKPKQAHGPDGKGEDRLIKNPDQLVYRLSAVVAEFSQLHTFIWESPLLPIPQGVFNALCKLSTITTFNIDILPCRDVVHTLPYWNLAHNVRSLAFYQQDHMEFYKDEVDEELTEAELMELDSPVEEPTFEDKEAREYLNLCMAFRTIIAAARGGHLRELQFADIQSPFAVRALLPCWVRIEEWPHLHADWAGAAMNLRELLAHASLWLGTKDALHPRLDRTLTQQEVQSLQSYFAKHEYDGDLYVFRLEDYWLQFTDELTPIKLYLPWLAEDGELAREVAEAWNAVVDAGEADVVKCICRRCAPKGGGRGLQMLNKSQWLNALSAT